MNVKKQLGQFYTTNYKYILQNMEIPDGIKNIIEPFAGKGDLLNFIKDKQNYIIEQYDVNPKCDNIIKRDTLRNPPCYDNKFILTNPPFLAKNKNEDKEIYKKYNYDDLYKCFIIQLINSNCYGGIIIIPLNFLCSMRKCDISLRESFIKRFTINVINIFEEKVFDDTSYTVCSIYFIKKSSSNSIKIYIYPSKKILNVSLIGDNNYTIGGEIYNLSGTYKIERATRLTKNINNITNILLKCIDDNIDSKLGFKIVNDKNKYIDNTKNLSSRCYATLVINKNLTLNEQEILVKKANNLINEWRKKYNSLFLTNYRESNTIARKRISFKLAFDICNYVLSS